MFFHSGSSLSRSDSFGICVRMFWSASPVLGSGPGSPYKGGEPATGGPAGPAMGWLRSASPSEPPEWGMAGGPRGTSPAEELSYGIAGQGPGSGVSVSRGRACLGLDHRALGAGGRAGGGRFPPARRTRESERRQGRKSGRYPAVGPEEWVGPSTTGLERNAQKDGFNRPGLESLGWRGSGGRYTAVR